MNLDQFLDRTWSQNYTCNEFACEVWKHITGEDLTERLNAFLNGNGSFTPLQMPESPCLAFFTRKGAASHIGLYVDGRLFHLTGQGVHFVELEIVAGGFQQPRFYK